MSAHEFASFDVNEIEVLNATDAVALPDMGASFVVIIPGIDGDDLVTEQDLSGSGSLSTSCC